MQNSITKNKFIVNISYDEKHFETFPFPIIKQQVIFRQRESISELLKIFVKDAYSSVTIGEIIYND